MPLEVLGLWWTRNVRCFPSIKRRTLVKEASHAVCRISESKSKHSQGKANPPGPMAIPRRNVTGS